MRILRIASAFLTFILASLTLSTAEAWEPPLCPNGSPSIAVFDSVFDDVQMRRANEAAWQPAKGGVPVCAGDRVLTGTRGRARIVWWDYYLNALWGPTVMNVGNFSEVEIRAPVPVEELIEISAWDKAVLLLKGTIRTFFKGFQGGQTQFEVRAGTSLCGIRGSEGISTFAPDKQTAEHMMDYGLMVCQAPTGDLNVKGGHQVVIVDGEFGHVQPLDRARYSALQATTRIPPDTRCVTSAQTSSPIPTATYRLA